MKILICSLLLFAMAANAEPVNSKSQIHRNSFHLMNKAKFKPAPTFGDSFMGAFGKSPLLVPEKPVEPFKADTSLINLNNYNRDQQKSILQSKDDDESCDAAPNITCFSTSNKEDQLYNLENDLKVCGCLKYRFNVNLSLDMSPEEVKKRNQKIEEGKLDTKLEVFIKSFFSKRDALLLEAHFSPGNQLELMKESLNTKEAAEILKAMLEGYRGDVSDEYINNRLQMINQKTEQVVAEESSSRTILENFNSATKKEDSCFPYSEYLKVTMLPNAKSFWEDLRKNASLSNTQNWNYTTIMWEYNSGQNIELNKAKLDFLNRNPSLKSIFLSKNEELKKQTYIKMRSELNPSSSCINSGTCRAAFISKGKSLQERLTDILDRPDIKSLLVATAFTNNIDDISKIGLRSFDKTADLDLASIRYAHSKKNIKYNDCSESVDDKKTDLCGDYLKSYCSDIYSNQDSLKKLFAENRIVQTYQNDWMNELEVDPIQNEGYNAFQKKMCQNMVRKFKGVNYGYNGFREMYCSTHACNSDEEVFGIFMKEAKSTEYDFDENLNLVKSQDLETKELAQATVNKQIKAGNISIAVINDVKKTQPFSGSPRGNQLQQSIKDIIAASERGEGTNVTTFPDPNNSKNESDEPIPETVLAETSSTLGFNSSDRGLVGSSFIDNNALSDARNEISNLKSEEKKIKQEVSDVEKEIKESTNPLISSALNSRLENLERMLAEKEKSSQEYQKLISKLLETKDTESSKVVARKESSEPKSTTEIPERTRNPVASSPVLAKGTITEEPINNSSRAPASTESFSTTTSGANSGGGATMSSVSTSLGSNASRAKINGALLSKYGIVVQDTLSTGVSVAQEADIARFQSIGAFKNADSIPIKVSQKAFEQFKINDLSALQDLYKSSIEKLDDDVVKIFVTSENSTETLEFYAVREEGKVVFQPIRKNKLSDLQNVLTH